MLKNTLFCLLFIILFNKTHTLALDVDWEKASYQVVFQMKNQQTTDTLYADLYFDEKGHAYFQDDSVKIYPPDTRWVKLTNEAGQQTKGIARDDSSWLFEVAHGPVVTCYSPEPFGKRYKDFLFSEKHSGKFYNYSKSNLKNIFHGHEQAESALKKHFTNRVVKNVLLFSGIGISLGAIVYTPLIVAGIVTSTSGLLFNKPSRRNLLKAVRIYE